MTFSKSDIKKHIKHLDSYLKANRDRCLCEYKNVSNNTRSSLASLNSVICGKNRELGKCDTLRFENFDEFMTIWSSNLKENDEKYQQKSLLSLIMKNNILQEYALKLLEKNFYDNYDDRTRVKPTEKQEIIWFGNNNKYAIYITPVYRNNILVNDRSEIRRVKFKYWSIGHIMTTGIYDCTNSKFIKFETYRDLINFFITLSQNAHYKYEQPIFNLYIEYLKNKYNHCIDNKDIDFINNSEPILIPELRFNGKEINHKYRMDFTILNSNINRYYGFELSPTSSHMSTSNPYNSYESKIELKNKWNKEMNKRNDYVYDFDICTITFSDDHLKDIQNCFDVILNYINKSNNNLENNYNYKDILNSL